MSYEQFAQYRLIEAAIGGGVLLLLYCSMFFYRLVVDTKRRNKDWKRALREFEQKEESRKD